MPFAAPINEPMVQIPYAADIFSGSGSLVWTVDIADWQAGGGMWTALWGKMLLFELQLSATSISGTGNQLLVKVPGGICFLSSAVPLGVFTWANGGTWTIGKVFTTAPNIIRLYQMSEANWPSITNNCHMRMSLLFPLK